MNDILLAHTSKGVLLGTYGQLQRSLTHAVLVIAPEKVQRHLPFQNLGHMLHPKNN